MASKWKEAGFDDTIASFLELAELLQSDADQWLKEASARIEEPFVRRQGVRMIFADIEGQISIAKRLLLFLDKFEVSESITETDRILLKEIRIDIDNRGEPVVKKAMIRLEDNIKYTFKIFSKVFGCDFSIPTQQAGNLSKAVAIRNRLTHPKTPQDLEINAVDFIVITEVWAWFKESWIELNKYAATLIREFQKELDRIKKDS